MSDYFTTPRKSSRRDNNNNSTNNIYDLSPMVAMIYDDNGRSPRNSQQLSFQQVSNEPLYNSVLALGTGFLSDVNLIVHTSKQKQDQEEVEENNVSVSAAMNDDGSTKIFKCHKLILSMNSVVFHTMFNGSLPETTDVHLHDTDPETFQIFLQFMYAGLFPTNLELQDLVSLLYLGRKYQMKELESILVDRIKEQLTPANTLQVIGVSLLYDLETLSSVCWTNIDSYSCTVLQGADWEGLSQDTLNKILTRSGLRIEEGELFNRTIEWAKAECQRRSGISSPTCIDLRAALGSTIYLFRFPTMSPTPFAEGPATTGLLSDSELASIFMYICTTKSPRPWPNGFSTEKRTTTYEMSNTNSSSNVINGGSGSGIRTLLEENNHHHQNNFNFDSSCCKCQGKKCFYCDSVAPYVQARKMNPKEVFEYLGKHAVLNKKWIRSVTPVSYCACRARNCCSMK